MLYLPKSIFFKLLRTLAHSGLLLSTVQSLVLGRGVMYRSKILNLGRTSRLFSSVQIFGSSVVVDLNGSVLGQAIMASLLLLLLFSSGSLIVVLKWIRSGRTDLAKVLWVFAIVCKVSVLTNFLFFVPVAIAEALVAYSVWQARCVVREEAWSREIRFCNANGILWYLPSSRSWHFALRRAHVPWVCGVAYVRWFAPCPIFEE
jgi:hypothetical protein